MLFLRIDLDRGFRAEPPAAMFGPRLRLNFGAFGFALRTSHLSAGLFRYGFARVLNFAKANGGARRAHIRKVDLRQGRIDDFPIAGAVKMRRSGLRRFSGADGVVASGLRCAELKRFISGTVRFDNLILRRLRFHASIVGLALGKSRP